MLSSMLARELAAVGYVADGKGTFWAPAKSICLDIASVAADLFDYLTLLVRRREKLRGRGANNLGADEARHETELAIHALKRCLDRVVLASGWQQLVHGTVADGCDSLADAIDRACTRHELLHWTPSEADRPEYDALGALLVELEAFVGPALGR